jgi:esterase
MLTLAITPILRLANRSNQGGKMTSQVRDEFVNLNSLRFHYRDWGDRSNPALICLHGASASAHNWDTFASEMSDQFRVIALDLRGHGESDWAEDYKFATMADDLAKLTETLDIQRLALVGHSMGGFVSWVFSSRHQKTVERLVLVDIAANVHDETIGSRVRRLLENGAQETFANLDEAIRAVIERNPRQTPSMIERRVRPNLIRGTSGRWRWRYDGAGLAARWPLAPTTEENWAYLSEVVCPTLLLRGSESWALSLEDAEQMARTMDDCRLIEVPGAGHGVHSDKPETFLAAVRPFLLDVKEG